MNKSARAGANNGGCTGPSALRNGTVERSASAWGRLIGVAGLAIGVLTTPRVSDAAVIWSSGFENNNGFNEWDYELNPEGLSIVTEPVAAGQYAMRAELTSERVWPNGIFRTELKYQPNESQANEGKETYFGWSVYLPAALPAGDYQLGYFETRSTYNQVFSLHAQGSDLSLVLNHSAAQGKHNIPGALTTGVWHRIVYHVKWSADPAQGFVSVWWDGKKVVDQAKAQTFVDDDAAVIQLGLLKNPPAPPDPIVLFVDEAIHGESYADVSLGIAEVTSPPVASVDPGAVTGEPSTSAATTSAATTSAPGSDPGVTTDVPGGTSTEPAQTAPATNDGSSSGCSVGGNAGGHASAGMTWLLALGALFLRHGRGGRRER